MMTMEGGPLYSKRELITGVTARTSSNTDLKFSIATYNILHDLPPHKQAKYDFCPREFISRDEGRESHRHKLLIEEVRWLDADILCLQEVDISYYDGILKPDLESLGYNGILAKEAMGLEEGSALFFKSEIFQLVVEKQVLLDDKIGEAFQKLCLGKPPEYPRFPTVLLLVALQHVPSSSLLAIGTSHIFWAYQKHTVTQALQIAFAAKALHSFMESLCSNQRHENKAEIPHIFCGDLNIDPNFPAYKLLSKGFMTDQEMARLRKLDYVKWKQGTQPLEIPPDVELVLLDALHSCFNTPLRSLESSYKVVLGHEPEFTDHEGYDNVWTRDYIWFSPDSIRVTGVLKTLPRAEIDRLGGMPNEFLPSDHLSLKANFEFINPPNLEKAGCHNTKKIS